MEEKLLGQALKLLRQAQGRRQNEVAQAADIKSGQLSNYERGNKDPSVRNLRKVLKALGCSWIDLDAAEKAILQGRQEEWISRRRREASPYSTDPPQAFNVAEEHIDLENLLRLDRPLPTETRNYFALMVQGYLGLLRHIANEHLP